MEDVAPLDPTLLVADVPPSIEPQRESSIDINADDLAALLEANPDPMDEILNQDFSDLIGTGKGRTSDANKSEDGSTNYSSVATPGHGGPGYSFHELFGDHFHTLALLNVQDHDAVEEKVVDPALVDSRTMLQTIFSQFVEEHTLDFCITPEQYENLFRKNKIADAKYEVESLFGSHFPAITVRPEDFESENAELRLLPEELRKRRRSEGFGLLKATMPVRPDITKTDSKATWLVEMPKLDPNRQVLHVDTQMYLPSKTRELISNERRLYTSQNIMRWTYAKQRDEALSNSRLVRWSDGSATLHVGTDIFEIATTTKNALSIISVPFAVHKNGVQLKAAASVVPYDEHVVCKPSKTESIHDKLVQENIANRSYTVERKIGLGVAQELPKFDMKKPRPERTPMEEYIIKDRERRKKEMQERALAGRPISLAEQIESEQKMLSLIKESNIEDLREQQEAQLRLDALSGKHRHQGTSRRIPGANDGEETPHHDKEGANSAYDDLMLRGDVDLADASQVQAAKGDEKRRPREEDEEEDVFLPRAKLSRVEAEQPAAGHSIRHAVASALKNLNSFPDTSLAHGVISSLAEVLDSDKDNGRFEGETLRQEIAKVIAEVREEFGDADLSSLETFLSS